MLRGQTEPHSGAFDRPMRWFVVLALLGCQTSSPAPAVPPPPQAPVANDTPAATPLPDCEESGIESVRLHAGAPKSRGVAKIDDRAPCARVRR